MERRGVFWVSVLALLVVSAYVVPYALFSGVDAWFGSFLFWAVFGLAAIGVITVMTLSWRD